MYNIIYKTFSKKPNYSNGEQIGGYQGSVGEEGEGCGRTIKEVHK